MRRSLCQASDISVFFRCRNGVVLFLMEEDFCVVRKGKNTAEENFGVRAKMDRRCEAGLRRCGKSLGIALIDKVMFLDMKDRVEGKGFHKHVAIAWGSDIIGNLKNQAFFDPHAESERK